MATALFGRVMQRSNRALIALFGLLLCGCGAAAQSAAQAPRAAETPSPAPALSQARSDPAALDWGARDSVSLRNPNDGSLLDGVPLPLTAPGLRFNPKRDPDARYGTVEMVRALVEAAARVERELGGLPITVNDLSLPRGGPIAHHGSHQSGRDVDVFFYQLGPTGMPIESVGAFFDPSGRGMDFRDLADPTDDVALTLDLPRTWLFLRALIEDEPAQLQQIFVAEHLRGLLIDYARAQHAPERTVERFEQITCQPTYPHDDHLHLRFFCTPDDIERGCRDSKPMYPWHLRRLHGAGVAPLPLAPRRPAAHAKIVTAEQARQAAGPMDDEVERWLDRRKAWMGKPHPGRPYCP